MKYETTTLKIVVHHKETNPIYDESCTFVSLDDEAGGLFLVIEQQSEDAKAGTIRLDPNEVDVVYNACKKLLNQKSAKT